MLKKPCLKVQNLRWWAHPSLRFSILSDCYSSCVICLFLLPVGLLLDMEAQGGGNGNYHPGYWVFAQPSLASHSLHFAPKMSLLSTKKQGRVLMTTSVDVACGTCSFPRILRENLRWSIFPWGNISKRIKSAQSEELTRASKDQSLLQKEEILKLIKSPPTFLDRR